MGAVSPVPVGGVIGAGGTPTGGAASTGGATGAAGGSGNCPSGAIFCDDFESGTTNWTVLQGTWSVIIDGTNVYGCALGTNEARSLAGSAAWTDYTVTARIKLVAMGASKRVHLAARVTDALNWYGADFYNDVTPTVQIRKKVAATSSTLATTPFAWVVNQWYLVAFKLSGTTLSMYIDGVLQLTASDTSFTSGRIALLSDQSQISCDDVVVTVP